LVNAQATLENKRKVTEKESARWLPAKTDLSLLFYSYNCARYVRIASVDRAETTIGSKTETQVTIHYQFVSHLSDNMSTHFALILLGKVKPGAVRVTIRQIPPIDEFGREDTPFRNARRYVCESTSFGVK